MDNENTQNSSDLNFHTDLAVGEILRRTRVYYGQTLEQVESILHIRASQLDALENGDISKLPGRVYAIGFVRSYSEYLGLDGDKMVYLFKEQSVGRKAKPDLSFPVPADESKIPDLKLVGFSFLGFLFLIGLISFFMYPKGEKPAVSTVPEKLTKSRLSDAPPLVKQAQKENQETDETKPASKNRIVLEITEASWIEIRNASGVAILRQVLKSGDKYLVPDESGLVMATGNAGGISVILDGKKIGKLGEAGEIRRKVSLTPESLMRKN